MDKIVLSNLEFYGYHGYFPEENILGQRFKVTIEAYGELSLSHTSGDLDDSVSYVDIYDVVNEVFFSKKYKILEQLGYDIGKAIIDKFFRIKSVQVFVMKPEVPIPVTCDYFGIQQEIKRELISYIGLGSNLGDREGYLNSAIHQLEFNKEIEVTKISKVYETDPFGYEDQGMFLNMVVEVKTSLSPRALLKYCNHIEGNLLRKRDVRWGPRTIDVDILTYDNYTSDEEILTLPHPGITQRAFVLLPLKDVVNDDFEIKGMNIDEMIAKVDKDSVRLFKESLS
ncbi:MAG: 2-amino-4-hydroxy-6-hydroxymethyldihydropteridine diphosphokinase [Firmicutes bacterium]|nr:2-amino-4-hydroxy-6-hydroxymethyldihydropteridine diphosphokinase [Bacillota bacterium]